MGLDMTGGTHDREWGMKDGFFFFTFLIGCPWRALGVAYGIFWGRFDMGSFFPPFLIHIFTNLPSFSTFSFLV